MYEIQRSHLVTFVIGLLIIPIARRAFARYMLVRRGTAHDGSSGNIYNLSHGKLNLNLGVPMWMSMGYWSGSDKTDDNGHEESITLAVASRKLLSEVLKTAGFSRERQSSEDARGVRRTKALIDLGFGCGEQTIYMNSIVPLRASDKQWWGNNQRYLERCNYIGITLDKTQFLYAQTRIHELHHPSAETATCSMEQYRSYSDNTDVFQADAAKPESWNRTLRDHIQNTVDRADEAWVLSLDALYHFSPSRWPVINFASRDLNANLMAFDLCLAHDISLLNTIALRVLTALMGAPWANFVPRDQYRDNLLKAGYQDITIRDISDKVFLPLSVFLDEHDRKLRAIGEGLGKFHLAKWMFAWWARTGIVRGVIVVAKRSGDK